MSELLNAANTIVPVITTAAAGFAGTVVQSAQNQAADSVVQRGRAFLGRLLERRPEDPRDDETAGAVEQIRKLSKEDRRILESAIGKWLAERIDDPQADLHELIRHETETHGSPGYHPGSITVTAHGPRSAAIGYVGSIGSLDFGDHPRNEQGEEPEDSER
ncbi:hypothetical protein I3F58_28475 [Streptomyces sp. MUM 203J]|uniref:hypothetical protein n=1 Tax=Streptomyces sp. MUM 203J TaxID=2791990 RepID=UPI001F03C495|nr:hypothetical protein [Streptomyces sp. MUM 203J]MCH0543415.1 hypothetical protein [Streptomyces sp. MUM 203J]